MARKNFSAGINAIIGQDEQRTRKSSESSIDENKTALTRTTVVMEDELLDILKALAYWERIHIKDVVKEAAEQYIASKEANYIKEAVRKYKESLRKN